jgi:hypothetical protein
MFHSRKLRGRIYQQSCVGVDNPTERRILLTGTSGPFVAENSCSRKRVGNDRHGYRDYWYSHRLCFSDILPLYIGFKHFVSVSTAVSFTEEGFGQQYFAWSICFGAAAVMGAYVSNMLS